MFGANGGVLAGETSIEAAIREVKEEIGLSLKSCEVFYFKRFINIDMKLLFDVFIAKRDYDIKIAVLQIEEVSEIEWVSIDVLTEMRNDGRFFDYPINLFNEIIDYIKNADIIF